MRGLSAGYDSVQGGWAARPKFPAASVVEFLLGRDEPRMALQTLRSMASGGIFDQVGGGFARYSVDATWTVPHFEKMLYDNALLARAYLHGYQRSGDPILRRTAEETLDWALREMRGPEGGFYSALDADSEGVEGKFYVWTLDELRAVLDPADADAAIAWFGATERGNFEGANILESRGPEPERRAAPADPRRAAGGAGGARAPGPRRQAPDRLERADDRRAGRRRRRARARGLPRRGPHRRRVRPRRAAHGRRPAAAHLQRRRGEIAAYLEDHAFLLEALLALYEATFEPRWFTAARTLADTLVAHFADAELGGFFSTADDGPPLLARRKELQDAPIPSGGASARARADPPGPPHRRARLRGARRRAAQAAGAVAGRHPSAFGHTAPGARPLPRPARARSRWPATATSWPLWPRWSAPRTRPHLVLAGGTGAEPPLLAGRTPVDGRAAAYVCERFACRRPVTTAGELADLLEP